MVNLLATKKGCPGGKSVSFATCWHNIMEGMFNPKKHVSEVHIDEFFSEGSLAPFSSMFESPQDIPCPSALLRGGKVFVNSTLGTKSFLTYLNKVL